MHTTVVPRFVRRLAKASSTMLIASMMLGIVPESASAATSSWSPTLLVNTESFQTIDAGDGTTDIELRFGSNSITIKFLNTSQKFQFSRSVSVLGGLSGSYLTIDHQANISGSLTVKGTTTLQSNVTAQGNVSVAGALSGSTFYGAGLGSCNGSTQKIVYNNATGKFECATDLNTATAPWSSTGSLQTAFDARYVNQSGDTMTGALNVRANLSGSSLTVDGTATVQNLSANGTANVNGAITTNSNLTINGDSGATDAVLTFGNASGDQTIKFLNTSQKFEFSKDIRVVGNISGSTLTIDGAATVQSLTSNGNIATNSNVSAAGNISAAGSLSGSTFYGAGLGSCNGTNQKIVYNNATGKFECATDQNSATPAWSNTGSLQTAFDARYVNTSGDTMTGSLKVRAGLSGSYLTVDHQANISGALTVKGAATLQSTLGVTGDVTTNANLTINGDAGAADAVLTFGNASGNQTVKFLNSSQKFEFSKDIRVVGNISGSTLTVDGALTLHGVSYNAPSAQGASNTYLKNDGAGNLTWQTVTTPNGSGGILSLHPEYPNAVYFSSGSTYVGQMTMSGGTNALDNSYVWTSSRSSLQDYWISVRVRLPDNFSSWDPVKPIEFRYKTGVASSANNALKVLIKDTAGTYVPLTGGSALANTSWTTANISGPEATGTWAAKGYVTVYIKLSANNTTNANAAASYLNLNYETTTP